MFVAIRVMILIASAYAARPSQRCNSRRCRALRHRPRRKTGGPHFLM